MRLFRIQNPIIRAALLLVACSLAACSSVRLAYNNSAQLAWWWIDGYVDFGSEQAPAVKQGLDRLLAWHRSTQLPELAGLLASAQGAIVEPTTAAAACRWQEQVRDKLEPTLQFALRLAAEQSAGLGEAQFAHMAQRYAKGNDEMRREFLQADVAERQAESVKRALERAERLYGRLDAAQKRVISDGVAASPFDPELWLAERQRRQRDVLQTLRRLAEDKADAEQRLTALRNLAQRVEKSPHPEYRSYQLRLGEYNCAFAAQIHNATTPAQRLRARDTLKAWEEDLRELRAAAL